ncbi:uncharacterized protein LOC134224733 [Armigeres subalbatus]|uniref:uncharacterized protein LOC134224733 n=1 Tax=Armigeres subalbatus TaxID=124917 RepID=UPI002ED03B34
MCFIGLRKYLLFTHSSGHRLVRAVFSLHADLSPSVDHCETASRIPKELAKQQRRRLIGCIERIWQQVNFTLGKGQTPANRGSDTIFGITTGNVQVMAHRDQLRVSNRTRHLKQSNVFMSMRGESSAPMGESHVEDDRGELPDISSRRKRKRRQDSCSEDALVEQPRRSKRMRKPNRTSDYIYGK